MPVSSIVKSVHYSVTCVDVRRALERRLGSVDDLLIAVQDGVCSVSVGLVSDELIEDIREALEPLCRVRFEQVLDPRIFPDDVGLEFLATIAEAWSEPVGVRRSDDGMLVVESKDPAGVAYVIQEANYRLGLSL